jgi:hypothetical protein
LSPCAASLKGLMRLAAVCLVLSLPLALSGAPAAPDAPQAPASGAPAAAPVELSLTLKDGQSTTCSLQTYDEISLVVSNAQGRSFSIPWGEVRAVSAIGSGPDAALMQQYLRPGDTEVETLIAARSPEKAFKTALWPGVLIHGAGYRAAGDNEAFLNLAGGEIFSAVLLTFGLNEALGPGIPGQTKITSQSIAVGGGVIFLATWAWDLLGASAAARDFNAANHLALGGGDGSQLALAYKF